MNHLDIYESLRYIPVSINNYYGDPTLQWDNTLRKVSRLNHDGHKGPVGVLTRGYINEKRAKDLRAAGKDLNLIVLVSISGLPPHIEPAGEKHRYITMRSCLSAGIPVMACVRPVISSINGNLESMERIVSQSVDAGVKNFVFSGIRGNDEILLKTDMTEEERQTYMLRVKLMPNGFRDIINHLEKKYEIIPSTRVACGVSKTLDLERCYNHYESSPLLSRCESCHLRERCTQPVKPREGSLELIKKMGYDIEFVERNTDFSCTTIPATRKHCPSCCTCCFMQDITRIEVRNQKITLGDLSLVRFITNVTAVKPGVVDGSPDTGHCHIPILPEYKNVHTVNSWYVMSRNLPKCLDCSYCIVQAYDVNDQTEYGIFPMELAKLLEERMGSSSLS
jgi:hypothetical protein